MDIKLFKGDFQTGENGLPVTIVGAEELLQKIIIRLTVPKGSFIYDEELGSRFGEIKYLKQEQWESAALSFAREALKDLPCVSVDRAVIACNGENIPAGITFDVSLSSCKWEVEVGI